MKIDLKSDAETVFNHLKKRVADYPDYVNIGPGEDDAPITYITLGYQVSQSGWVALIFDTRPDGGPDGEWQAHIGDNCLEFSGWLKAVDALWDDGEPIELILHDGKKETLGQDDDLAAPVGQMLASVLVRARTEKCFHDLPLAENRSMGVEDHDGAFGWPSYDNRFTDGRLT